MTSPVVPPFISSFKTYKPAEFKDENDIIYLKTHDTLAKPNDKETFLKNTYITVIMPIRPEGPLYTGAAKQLFNVIVDNNNNLKDDGSLEFTEGTVKSQNVEIYKKTRTSTVLQNTANEYKKNVLYKFNVLTIEDNSENKNYNDAAKVVNDSNDYYTSETFSKIIQKLKGIIYDISTAPDPNLALLYGEKRTILDGTVAKPFLGGGGRKKNKVTKRKQKRIRKKNNKTNTSKNTN